MTIAAGGSVTFRNDDDRAHTVTANDGAFNSCTIPEGASWKRTFKEAGTFSYLCAIHPEMTGKVVVKGSSPAATPKPKPSPTPKPVSQPTATGVDAEIHDFAFAPPQISVPVGSTVTWRNTGAAPHTVTAEDGSFDSETIAIGGSWARTFDTAGTFPYVCAFHPQIEGTVEVTAGEVAAAPPSSAPAAVVPPPTEAPSVARPTTAEPAAATAASPPRARASGASSWRASRSSGC